MCANLLFSLLKRILKADGKTGFCSIRHYKTLLWNVDRTSVAKILLRPGSACTYVSTRIFLYRTSINLLEKCQFTKTRRVCRINGCL